MVCHDPPGCVHQDHQLGQHACCRRTKCMCCGLAVCLQMDHGQLAEALAPHTVQWLCQHQLKQPLEVGGRWGVCVAPMGASRRPVAYIHRHHMRHFQA
jgi:hypothetical protein